MELPYDPVELYVSVNFLEQTVRQGQTKRLPSRGSKEHTMLFTAIAQAKRCYEGLHQIRADLDQTNLESLDMVMRDLDPKRGIEKDLFGFGSMTVVDETWEVMNDPEQYDIQLGDDFRPVYTSAEKILRSYQRAANFYQQMKKEDLEVKLPADEDIVTAKIRLTPSRPLPKVSNS